MGDRGGEGNGNLFYQPRSHYQPTLTQIQVQGLKFYKTLSRHAQVKSEHKPRGPGAQTLYMHSECLVVSCIYFCKLSPLTIKVNR